MGKSNLFFHLVGGFAALKPCCEFYSLENPNYGKGIMVTLISIKIKVVSKFNFLKIKMFLEESTQNKSFARFTLCYFAQIIIGGKYIRLNVTKDEHKLIL